MSTNNDDARQTYRIETNISAGHITDPVTAEQHDVDAKEDGKGGVIEVSRPDSARALVENSNTFDFAGSAPTPEAVAEAQRDRFEFAESDVCMAFANQYHHSFEEMDLGPANGFDPEVDPTYNDPRMKAAKAYTNLRENGHDYEAEYLRALPSTSDQEEFVTFLRKKGLIDNE